jgi:dipeptidyl aminopeptidase/acylaminoacyl peptidase
VAGLDSIDKPKLITNSNDGPIYNFEWDYTNNIVYYKDNKGDENNHLYRVNINNGFAKDLTPGDGLKANILAMSSKHPNEMVIAVNDRDKEMYDVKKVNLTTGKTEMLYKNIDNVSAQVDTDFKIRLGSRITEDGGKELLKYKNNKWEVIETLGPEDEMLSEFITITKDNRYVYLVDGKGRDTTAIYKVEIDSWNKQLIAQDPKADIYDWVIDSKTEDVRAVCFYYDKQNWQALDDTIKPDLDYLKGFREGQFYLKTQSLDGRRWIVTYESDTQPIKYYIYDKQSRNAELLSNSILTNSYFSLDNYKLSTLHPRVIESKDGLNLVSYLSLPPWSDPDNDGIPNTPLPMVINVHGGPASRIYWGFNGLHQFFANRGYAILSVNFRGSYGFGKKFLNWGNGEWGGKMQEDINDAMDWAIAQKIAIPAKVCIFGGSYGGYSVLAGLAFTPDRFACGIDYVGVSNLMTFVKSIPTYWKSNYRSLLKQLGADPDTEAGKIFLKSRSPLTHADMIIRPLLIAHGQNDPRVKVAESEQIVKALQERGVPVVYCLYPDEGHGFRRWQNSLAFYTIIEEFLAKTLEGRAQKMKVEDFSGSTIDVKAGKEYFEGLEKLLPSN